MSSDANQQHQTTTRATSLEAAVAWWGPDPGGLTVEQACGFGRVAGIDEEHRARPIDDVRPQARWVRLAV